MLRELIVESLLTGEPLVIDRQYPTTAEDIAAFIVVYQQTSVQVNTADNTDEYFSVLRCIGTVYKPHMAHEFDGFGFERNYTLQKLIRFSPMRLSHYRCSDSSASTLLRNFLETNVNPVNISLLQGDKATIVDYNMRRYIRLEHFFMSARSYNKIKLQGDVTDDDSDAVVLLYALQHKEKVTKPNLDYKQLFDVAVNYSCNTRRALSQLKEMDVVGDYYNESFIQNYIGPQVKSATTAQ